MSDSELFFVSSAGEHLDSKTQAPSSIALSPGQERGLDASAINRVGGLRSDPIYIHLVYSFFTTILGLPNKLRYTWYRIDDDARIYLKICDTKIDVYSVGPLHLLVLRASNLNKNVK